MIYDLVIVGGGAAGFFTAVQCKERKPDLRILILEKSSKVLSKVRISGGGRCNVTHACFEPSLMVEHYPRGQKELLGPFHRFLCGDMMEWLEANGVPVKIEDDGRVFPVSDSSGDVIDCFLRLCNKYKVEIRTKCNILDFKITSDCWEVQSNQQTYQGKTILIATGSSDYVWKILEQNGHTIIKPVPSLFTFNIKHPLLQDLQGISFPQAVCTYAENQSSQTGPLLITHWGLSGPAVLKLSAWEARNMHQNRYKFQIIINWIDKPIEEVADFLNAKKKEEGNQSLKSKPILGLPKRFWSNLIAYLRIQDHNFADLKSSQVLSLAETICSCKISVDGKSNFKDEFVTAGGVDTNEIDFRTMESKVKPGLYLAGEVINIDAITGGFNFQAAWTESFIAAHSICTKLKF